VVKVSAHYVILNTPSMAKPRERLTSFGSGRLCAAGANQEQKQLDHAVCIVRPTVPGAVLDQQISCGETCAGGTDLNCDAARHDVDHVRRICHMHTGVRIVHRFGQIVADISREPPDLRRLSRRKHADERDTDPAYRREERLRPRVLTAVGVRQRRVRAQDPPELARHRERTGLQRTIGADRRLTERVVPCGDDPHVSTCFRQRDMCGKPAPADGRSRRHDGPPEEIAQYVDDHP
jgi:hypothetical protein